MLGIVLNRAQMRIVDPDARLPVSIWPQDHVGVPATERLLVYIVRLFVHAVEAPELTCLAGHHVFLAGLRI